MACSGDDGSNENVSCKIIVTSEMISAGAAALRECDYEFDPFEQIVIRVLVAIAEAGRLPIFEASEGLQSVRLSDWQGS